MQGDARIDELMRPVMTAIKRHVKDSDAVTEIYNRAYEALMISMDVNQPSKSNGSVTQDVLMDIKTPHSVKSDGSGITFCQNCEAETDCHFDAELWSCNVCGEDFAAYTKPAYNSLKGPPMTERRSPYRAGQAAEWDKYQAHVAACPECTQNLSEKQGDFTQEGEK